jgi:hypothetical protein
LGSGTAESPPNLDNVCVKFLGNLVNAREFIVELVDSEGNYS